jgi:uncharacterized membrane protein
MGFSGDAHVLVGLLDRLTCLGQLVGDVEGEKAGSGGGDTPLDQLERRYAAGEITSQEYEERKAKLTRDREVG